MNINYLDPITIIRKGGNSRNGKVPDKLIDVFFVRYETDYLFRFVWSLTDPRHTETAWQSDIIAVKGKPYK